MTETKVVEEFIEEQGRKFKVTRKIKVSKEKEKISKKVLEREARKKKKKKINFFRNGNHLDLL